MGRKLSGARIKKGSKHTKGEIIPGLKVVYRTKRVGFVTGSGKRYNINTKENVPQGRTMSFHPQRMAMRVRIVLDHKGVDHPKNSRLPFSAEVGAPKKIGLSLVTLNKEGNIDPEIDDTRELEEEY